MSFVYLFFFLAVIWAGFFVKFKDDSYSNEIVIGSGICVGLLYLLFMCIAFTHPDGSEIPYEKEALQPDINICLQLENKPENQEFILETVRNIKKLNRKLEEYQKDNKSGWFDMYIDDGVENMKPMEIPEKLKPYANVKLNWKENEE